VVLGEKENQEEKVALAEMEAMEDLLEYSTTKAESHLTEVNR
jgi:hypothetical protein